VPLRCIVESRQSRHSVGASDFPEPEPTGISQCRSVPDSGIKISNFQST
jgi:hypothetical protein